VNKRKTTPSLRKTAKKAVTKIYDEWDNPEAVEKKIGYKLPLDYIAVIKEQNGARPVQYRFDIEGKT
jgi:hypothetical protein